MVMNQVLDNVYTAIRHHTGERIAVESPSARQYHAGVAQRRLLNEARRLNIPLPSHAEVDAWFVETQLEYLISYTGQEAGNASLKALHDAHRKWQEGALYIPAHVFHVWRFMESLAVYSAGRKRHPAAAVVAFDCDGVLYNFNDTLREWLVAHGWRRDQLPEPTVYSLADAWGLHDDHLQKEISSAVMAGEMWNVGAPLMDGISAAQTLGHLGHEIIVNTARKIPGLEQVSRAATIVWLRSHGVHPDGLHLADPREPADKLAIDFDIILDDHASNVDIALRHGRAALLIDRPWNKGETNIPRATFAEAIRVIDRQRMPMPAM